MRKWCIHCSGFIDAKPSSAVWVRSIKVYNEHTFWLIHLDPRSLFPGSR
jgi:hypothetical protein